MRRAVVIAVALLFLLPATGWGQSPSIAEAARKARAKKSKSSGKVWTNEDFRKSSLKTQKGAQKNKEPAKLFAELDAARKQSLTEQENLADYQSLLEKRRADLQISATDYDRTALREEIEQLETSIEKIVVRVKNLKEKIVRLEEQTKGLKRPKAPKTAKIEVESGA